MKNFFQRLKNSVYKIFQKSEVQIFLITLAIHSAAVVFFAMVQIPLLANGGDDVFYFESGARIAELLKQGDYHWGDVYQHHWYPLFLGIIFFFFGSLSVLGTITNAILVSISAVLCYKILQLYDVSERVSYWGSLVLFSAYASYLYHSSLLIKESWVIVLLLGMVYLGIRLARGIGNRVLLFWGILVLFVFLKSLRHFVGFAGMVGVMSYWLLHALVPIKKRIIQGVGMILCVLVIVFTLHGQKILGSITVFDGLDLNTIHKTRTSFFGGGSTTMNFSVIQKTTIPDQEGSQKHKFSLGGFVQSLFTTVAGPFPWQISAKKYSILLPDILLWYIIVGIVTVGLIRFHVQLALKTIPWILAVGAITGALALGTDNIGALIRFRIPMVIMLGMVALIIVSQWMQKYEK